MQSPASIAGPPAEQGRDRDHHQRNAAGGYQDVSCPHSPDTAGLEGGNCPADNQRGESAPDQVFAGLLRHQRRRGKPRLSMGVRTSSAPWKPAKLHTKKGHDSSGS